MQPITSTSAHVSYYTPPPISIEEVQTQTTAFFRFKAIFMRESETVTLLRQEHVAIDTLVSLCCTVNPFSYEGHLLKEHLKKIKDSSVIEKILTKFLEAHQIDYKKIVAFFDEAYLRQMTNEPDLESILEGMSRNLPLPLVPIKTTFSVRISKTLQVASRFFPNFMDTILKALNLVETGRGPQTIWDFAAMLEIYYKIFMIPFAIFIIVGTFVAIPLKAIAISTAIVLSLAIIMSLYVANRPRPNKIPYCINLTEEAQNGKLDPVVGVNDKINKLEALLGSPKEKIPTCIVLVGKPGVGKTQMVRGLAARCTRKTIHAINGPDLTSGGLTLQDAIPVVLNSMKGYENQIVLFIDEFGDSTKKNPGSNLSGCLKAFMGGQGIQVIVSATEEEYAELKKSDKPFADRLHKIHLEPLSESEVLKILEMRIEIKAPYRRIQDQFLPSLMKMTKDKSQPRSAVMLLDRAINEVSNYPIRKYESKELKAKKEELRIKEKEYQMALDSRGSLTNISLELNAIREQSLKLQEESDHLIKVALETKKLIKVHMKLKWERSRLARLQGDKKELIFLNWFLLPHLNQRIISNLKITGSEIPLEINTDLLKKNLT